MEHKRSLDNQYDKIPEVIKTYALRDMRIQNLVSSILIVNNLFFIYYSTPIVQNIIIPNQLIVFF